MERSNMRVFKKHAILTAVGSVVGIAAVFWLRPTTSGGAVFVVTVCLILVNAIGAIRFHKS
jgi:hypothetical protein